METVLSKYPKHFLLQWIVNFFDKLESLVWSWADFTTIGQKLCVTSEKQLTNLEIPLKKNGISTEKFICNFAQRQETIFAWRRWKKGEKAEE